MECEKCRGEYFKTTELMDLHFREKHEKYAEQLSVIKREMYDSFLVSVQESDPQKPIGNSRLIEANEGSNICVESKSADVANLPGIPLTMSTGLVKERHPDNTEQFPDFVIEKVSGFTIEDCGTNSITKSLSPADNPLIGNSECLQTHAAEVKETMEITGIDSAEEIAIDIKTLSSIDESIRIEDNGPYYCPDCGKGLGYSYNAYLSHIGRNKGICKRLKSGRIFYICQFCKTYYSNFRTLEEHNTRFGDTCKTWQINMNKGKTKLQAGPDIPQRVQTMDVTDSEPTRDNTELHSPFHLITEEDSNPYYCPDCGRGLGYSYKSLQNHIGRYTGHCKEKFNGRVLYGCKYCREEFHELCNLTIHNRKFGDTCKTKQIKMNKNNIIFNYDGDVRKTMKFESYSPLGGSLTDDELQNICDNLSTVQNGTYSCPLCGKGVGYSFTTLKSHLRRYRGLCREMCTKKTYYTCQYCKFDYSTVYALRNHNKKFGNRCNLSKKRLKKPERITH